MRMARTILIQMACVAVLSGAAFAQDRPLFGGKSGADPAAAKTADAPASPSALTGEVLPTAAALGATLLAIVVARSLIARYGSKLRGGRPSGVVEVLARYPVARGQSVVLLKVGRRVIVAHQGSQSMRTLSEFTANDDVADILARCEAGSRKGDFSFDALLRQSGKSFDETAEAPAASESRARAATLRRSAGLAPAAASALEAYGVTGAEVETVDLTRRRKGARA